MDEDEDVVEMEERDSVVVVEDWVDIWERGFVEEWVWDDWVVC